MRRILLGLISLMVMANTSWATVDWNKSIPATSENPQAISPDVIENNTATDLMLQNYRDGNVYVRLISTSEIDVGPGGVMLSNSGGSTRLMVANASLTAVSSTNIDTDTISASATYYLYAYASSTTATTFSVIFSSSNTSPTGITYYAPLGSFTTDGSKNFISATSSVNAQIGLGSWASKTPGSIYQASTDGFFMGYNSCNQFSSIQCITDSNATPTTVRTYGYVAAANASYVDCMAPVKKNDYYQVNAFCGGSGSIGTDYAYFISLGS